MSKPSARPPSLSQLRSSATAYPMFKSGDLKALHLNRAKLELALHLFKDGEEEVASSKETRIEKHQTKNQKNSGHTRGRQHTGHHEPQCRQYVHKLSRSGIVAPCHAQNVYNLDNAEYDSDIISGSNETKKPTRHSISETSKNVRRSSQDLLNIRANDDKTKAHLLSAPKAQPVLTLKGHTGLISRSVTDRKKYPRLVGADLYVARLGWKAPPNNANSCCGSPKELDDISTSPPKPLTGSLHDELINPVSKSTSTISLPVTLEKQPSVLASRPCYRCISYMNSVGIKRVFWTTDTGMWEGAKVRDLIDAMEDLACADTTDTAAAVNNVFVTKHEVLMLRRTMGDI